MMKINLSGDKEDNQSEDTIAPTEDQTLSDEVPEEIEQEITEDVKPPDNKKRQTVLLVALLVVAAVAGGYLNKDKIMSYFPRKAPVIESVAPVVEPPQQPEVEVIETEPDPAFVTLNQIGESVPPRLWLTTAVIKYDGSYTINGMAFSYKSMTDIVAMLEGKGTIGSKTIPGKSKSTETVYRFGISGNLEGVDVPEILDAIPTDELVALAEEIKNREKELGVKFSRLPKPGASYTDKHMPFALEGSFEGLKNTIAVLCPEGGDRRVFNLTISPSTPGRAFDKIRASFSLKTVSSI